MHTNHNEYKNNQIHHSNDELSMLPFFPILFRYRWLAIKLMLAGAIIAGVYATLMYKKSYKVNSSIFLKSSRYVTDVNRVDPSDILKSTYEIVLKTNQLLEKVVLYKYDYTVDGKKESINLLKYYNTDNISTVIKSITNNLTLAFDKKNLILTLSYIDADPEMAAQIIDTIVGELDCYYNTKLTKETQRTLEFVIKNLGNAKKELNDARNKLDVFITTNKQLKNISKQKGQYSTCYSSATALQELEEEVDSKTKTYNDLKISYEKLRLQVTENAPTIIVLEKAIPPQDPIPCRYIKASVAGTFFGLFIATAYIFLMNLKTLFRLKTSPLETISAELKKDLKKLNIFKL